MRIPFRRRERLVLTDEIRAKRCLTCGGWHTRECPRVKILKIRPGEAETEFFTVGWDKDQNVLWEEDFDEFVEPKSPKERVMLKNALNTKIGRRVQDATLVVACGTLGGSGCAVLIRLIRWALF